MAAEKRVVPLLINSQLSELLRVRIITQAGLKMFFLSENHFELQKYFSLINNITYPFTNIKKDNF